ISFHPSGKTVALACVDNHVRIHDVTGKMAKEPVLVKGHQLAVQVVAYSPDGKTLASGSADKTIRLYDATLEVPKEKAVMVGHPAPISALAFTPDGATLAVACDDGSMRLWDVPAAAQGAKAKAEFGDPLKTSSIHSLSFSGDGRTLAA